jgi:hypothetical protein
LEPQKTQGKRRKKKQRKKEKVEVVEEEKVPLMLDYFQDFRYPNR